MTTTVSTCRKLIGLAIILLLSANVLLVVDCYQGTLGRQYCDLVADLTAPPSPTSPLSPQPPPGQRDPSVTPINRIQGSVPAPDPDFPTPYPGAGDRVDDSPLLGETVTIEGVVIGWDDKAGQSNSGKVYHNDRGIFVQEEQADEDGDPVTSEGIFVQFRRFTDEVAHYPIGAVVSVFGNVVEHFETTAIHAAKITVVGEGTLPSPVVIDESSASRDYYESLEGMRVLLKRGVANSGGVNKFGELFLTPGTERGIVMRGAVPPGLLGISADAGAGNPRIPRRPEKPSSSIVLADIFAMVEGVTGPLAYSFDHYKIVVQTGLDGSPPPLVTPSQAVSYPYSERPPSALPALRLATMNLKNFLPEGARHDGGRVSTREYLNKQGRIVDAIDRLLARPHIVAVQEAYDLKSLEDIAVGLGGYTTYLEEGNDDRGIDVGFLVTDEVTVKRVTQYGKNERNSTGRRCGDSERLLFDRPPFALEVAAEGLSFTVINVHFSSKAAPDACRIAQAEFVLEVAAGMIATGQNVIAAGDFNTFEDETPLRILTASHLRNLWFESPKEKNYSLQFSGRLQTLDHILVSEALADVIIDFHYAHISTHYYDRSFTASGSNAGFTDGHAQSDHDPAIVTLGTK